MTDTIITPAAQQRCAAHSLQEQLAQLRSIHAVELALAKKRWDQSHDQDDINTAFAGDEPDKGKQ